MYRNARQAKILEIINRSEIETQEELCSELNKLNFNVTQATVSRDIKDLRLYNNDQITIVTTGSQGEPTVLRKSSARACSTFSESAF